MRTKLFSSVLAATLFAGVLSGCASSQNTGTSVSTAQGGVESSAAQVKTVNVALESGSRPLSFESDVGEEVGYEVDVLEATGELITDYDFNIELVESDATQIGLEIGKYALIGGGLYKTPEREQKYLIPNAINGVDLINIYVDEDDDLIKSFDDLVGEKLVSSTPNGGIFNLLNACNQEHLDERIMIIIGDGISVTDRFKPVSDKEYDALVLPSNLSLVEIKEELGLEVKTVTPPVKISDTYFTLTEDQTDLSAKVEQALKTLRENGALSELSETWYGEGTIQYFTEQQSSSRKGVIPAATGINFSYAPKITDRISRAIPYALFIIMISGSFEILLAAGIAVVRIRKWKVLSPLANIYVSFFHSTPPLTHIFLVYYGLPLILREFGINASSWSETSYVSLALILSNDVHMSECLYLAYLAVERGQHDVADSIGMTSFIELRRIILPQMLPIAWPNLENAFIELIKDTSMLFVIGPTDIMGMAKKIISNDYGVEKLKVYLAVAVIYWCITSVVSKLYQLFKKRITTDNQTEKRVR